LQKQLGGDEATFYVVGCVETTIRPRPLDLTDALRFGAGVVEFTFLVPLSFTRNPEIFRQTVPPPPHWIRTDQVSVHVVKGKSAALELAYAFTTARLLDPPDPNGARHVRTWYLLKRTNKVVDAEALARRAEELRKTAK
jgi:hypothetical protein